MVTATHHTNCGVNIEKKGCIMKTFKEKKRCNGYIKTGSIDGGMKRESKKVVVDNPFVKSGRSYIRKRKKKITPGSARKSYHGNVFSLPLATQQAQPPSNNFLPEKKKKKNRLWIKSKNLPSLYRGWCRGIG